MLRIPAHKRHLPSADLGPKWLLTCPCVTQVQQRGVTLLFEGKSALQPEKLVDFA